MENKKLEELLKIVSITTVQKDMKIEILDESTSGKLYGGWKPICIKKNSGCVNNNC